MTESVQPAPAFGQADLTNCEREQIHLAGSIQPHGALLVVDERDLSVVQASANAASFLGLRRDVLGCKLDEFGGDIAEKIAPHLAKDLGAVAFGVRFEIGDGRAIFDAMIHRPPAGGLIVEVEKPGAPVDLAGAIETALEKIVASPTLRAHCDETAETVRELTGYDRVMVYRFDEQGHGQIFSESRKPDLESFLGNWYPASDIPQIARRLYERNRIRVLVDVTYEPVPIVPSRSPLTGQELDMSLCILRSSSPIHVQYLRNMGVTATLVISLMVHGRLWGLIACHHYGPRYVNFETRAVCEVIAEAVGTRIAALETFVLARAEMSVRRLQQRMIEAISREGDWRSALFESPQALLQPLRAAGAALIYDGQVMATGEAPGAHDVRAIASWIAQRNQEPVFSSDTFASDNKTFSGLVAIAAGVSAIRVSNSGDDWLIWFRPERIRTVTWGGDPTKPVEIGNSPADLSPRRSFAQWHQLVVGTSEAWTADDVAAARLIGETVEDVALQYQSVRSLIIQDQMRAVSRTVSISETPVATADADGEIIFSNKSFQHFVGAGRQTRNVREMLRLFRSPPDAEERLRSMMDDRRSWRGEVVLARADGSDAPMLLRADPVVAAPDRTLGYVFIFADLTERKAADRARRHFQDGLMERYSVKHGRLDTEAELVYRRLMSSIVENAQVAALEIAESEQVTDIPSMLDSVGDSVSRSAEVLETLVTHAMRASAAAAPAKAEARKKVSGPKAKKPRKPEPR